MSSPTVTTTTTLLRSLRTNTTTTLPATRRTIHQSSSHRSQIGKLPLAIPPNVQIHLPAVLSIPSNISHTSIDARRTVRLVGPLGQAQLALSPAVVLHPSTTSTSTNTSPKTPQTLTLSVLDPSIKSQKAIWGLTRALLQNAVHGVSEGYRVALRLVGVGYRAGVEEIPQSLLDIASRIPTTSRTATDAAAVARPTHRLNLKLGYAHPIYIDIPAAITVTTPQPTRIVLSGTDKQALGLFAAKIRRWRKPEPYRGKGIFVGDETIKIKEIKKK
ncbi:hypothetical protein QFC21_003284 [Naganishia friedmannii]|uniref:Uncharacterized protein n=1 Tax=Naganishia friedmannii TaxID=89922 RepID=A0ACC2VR05_9TREE|nr:hypothetical protein QFC21_003284 [Naganishia friedmannii]